MHLSRIASLCADFDVDGMRADLVIARTARAHAAWRGDTTVTDEDIRIAAELALPHRRRRDPFDEPGVDQTELDEALDRAEDRFPDTDADAEADAEPPQAEDDGDDSEPADQPDSGEQPEPTDHPDQPEPQPAPGGNGGIARQGDPFRR